QQAGLAGAVAAHQAHFVAGLQREGRAFQHRLPGNLYLDLLRLEHACNAKGGEGAAPVPVKVERAEAGSWLALKLAEPVPEAATVVFHSIVMQYLEEGQRRLFEEVIATAAPGATTEAPPAWLRREPAGAECALSLTLWPSGREEVIARSGFHGERVRPSAP
ncbi:MAG: DUF2332 family protein, partial [Actinomycetota bacterium]|nr:DUF2332 family protein [Actinomycetota bacterium]